MPSARPKRIHLIRHGEAEHNVTGDLFLHDPDLTSLGIEQSQQIPQTALAASDVQLVVSSPLRRTLRTASLGFPSHAMAIDGKQPILALAELQEAGPHPCDMASELRIVKQLFPHVDASLLDANSHRKEGRNMATHDAHLERAKWVRAWLRDRPESDIAVISHWGILFYLTVPDPLSSLGDGWRNTECRTFTFASDDSNELVLVNDKETPLAHQSLPFPIAA